MRFVNATVAVRAVADEVRSDELVDRGEVSAREGVLEPVPYELFAFAGRHGDLALSPRVGVRPIVFLRACFAGSALVSPRIRP